MECFRIRLECVQCVCFFSVQIFLILFSIQIKENKVKLWCFQNILTWQRFQPMVEVRGLGYLFDRPMADGGIVFLETVLKSIIEWSNVFLLTEYNAVYK